MRNGVVSRVLIQHHASLQLDVNNIRKYNAREIGEFDCCKSYELNDIKRAFKAGVTCTNTSLFCVKFGCRFLSVTNHILIVRIITKDVRVSKRNKNAKNNDVSKTSNSWFPDSSSSHLHVSSRRI